MYKYIYFKIEIKTKVDSYMPCEAMAHSPKWANSILSFLATALCRVFCRGTLQSLITQNTAEHWQKMLSAWKSGGFCMAHVYLCWCLCKQVVQKISFLTRFDKVLDSFDTNWLLNDLITHRLKKKDTSDSSKEGKGSSKKLSGTTKTSWWGFHYLDIAVYSH